MNPIGGLTPQDRDDYVALAEDRDPSTETWRETVGLSTRDLRRELAEVREEFEETYADLAQARYELKQERLEHRQAKKTLAASQQDLTRVEKERDEACALSVELLRDTDRLRTELAAAQKPCAWRDLAVTAMQERDLARAQLDDAIATFRADKEKS